MNTVAVRPRLIAVPRLRAVQGWLRDRPILVALIVALVVVSQGHNMLHYPYLEDDEGTYSSQAWAVFHLGRLSRTPTSMTTPRWGGYRSPSGS
jgi:hypothetical protein